MKARPTDVWCTEPECVFVCVAERDSYFVCLKPGKWFRGERGETAELL